MGTLRIESISTKFDKQILGRFSLLNVMGLLKRPSTSHFFSDDVDLWSLPDKQQTDSRNPM